MNFGAHQSGIGNILTYNGWPAVNVDPYTLGFTVSSSSNIPDIQLLGHCVTERCLPPVVSVEPDTNSLSVAWVQRGSESLWRVEYREERDSTWTVVDSVANTTYAIMGLNAGTRYQVRVGSVCSDNNIAYSDVVTIATLNGDSDTVWHQVTVTTSPDGIAATYGSGRYAHGDTVEIGFHLPDTAAEGGYWQFIGWDDTNSTDNPRIVVVVSDTLFTALFQWVADSVGIVDEEGLTRWVSVYPNPASHTVVIRSERDCTVAFLSADGREVMRMVCRAGDNPVDIQHLAQGVYFLRVIDLHQPPIKLIVTKE